MLYLLDANMLIDAARDYYPVKRVPQFWEWILAQAKAGRIKLPDEIHGEVIEGRGDDLVDWIKLKDVKQSLVFDEEPDIELVNRVVADGYAPDLTEAELEAVGHDPFLIGYALVEPDTRCVVTTERSKPRKQRQNRKIPDVCLDLGVRSIDTFQLIRDLDFNARS